MPPATTFMPSAAVRTAVKLRGAAMLTIGAVALVGTADDVFGAMNAVAIVVCLTAVGECVLLWRDRSRTAAWWLTLADAVLAGAYGGLTLSLPAMLSSDPPRAIAAVNVWLLCAVSFTGLLTLHVWGYRLPRAVLIGWVFLNGALALAGPTDPPVAIAGLFVGGAVYTAVLGALELAGAVWIDRTAVWSSRRNPSGS